MKLPSGHITHGPRDTKLPSGHITCADATEAEKRATTDIANDQLLNFMIASCGKCLTFELTSLPQAGPVERRLGVFSRVIFTGKLASIFLAEHQAQIASQRTAKPHSRVPDLLYLFITKFCSCRWISL